MNRPISFTTGFFIYLLTAGCFIFGASCAEKWMQKDDVVKVIDKPTTVKVTSTKETNRTHGKTKIWTTGSGRAANLGATKFERSKGDGRAFGLGLGGTGSAGKVARGEASPGAPASAPSAVLAKPAPSKYGAKMRPRAQPFPGSGGILTAGSFDDRLDMDFFMDYWRASSLARHKQLISDKDFAKAKARRSGHGFDKLQLSFVVDVTGSMGDELDYLKREFQGIVAQIDHNFPGHDKEFSLIVYRDDGDAFVTRGMDFTKSITEFQGFIDQQSAGGGGDYPEAVHTALEDAAKELSWSEKSSVARMMFLIADAPAHDQSMEATFDQVRKLRDQGVAIYPVAASGVQDLAEEMMRATAVMTQGQYIFLTDDSGVGNAHAKPKFPCYHVEKLKDVMVRMVSDKLNGKASMPLAKNIVRTVGSPDGSVCRTGIQFVRSSK